MVSELICSQWRRLQMVFFLKCYRSQSSVFWETCWKWKIVHFLLNFTNFINGFYWQFFFHFQTSYTDKGPKVSVFLLNKFNWYAKCTVDFNEFLFSSFSFCFSFCFFFVRFFLLMVSKYFSQMVESSLHSITLHFMWVMPSKQPAITQRDWDLNRLHTKA